MEGLREDTTDWKKQYFWRRDLSWYGHRKLISFHFFYGSASFFCKSLCYSIDYCGHLGLFAYLIEYLYVYVYPVFWFHFGPFGKWLMHGFVFDIGVWALPLVAPTTSPPFSYPWLYPKSPLAWYHLNWNCLTPQFFSLISFLFFHPLVDSSQLIEISLRFSPTH